MNGNGVSEALRTSSEQRGPPRGIGSRRTVAPTDSTALIEVKPGQGTELIAARFTSTDPRRIGWFL